MNKKVILLLSAAILIGGAAYAVPGPFGYDLQKDINRKKTAPKSWETDQQQQTSNNQGESDAAKEGPIFLDKYSTNPGYYTNPTLKSVKDRYNKGNYTGALQELYALLKKEPSNAEGYYYLAMVYTKLGDTGSANSCYQKVISLSYDEDLVRYAKKGKACLNEEPACYQDETVQTATDALQNVANTVGEAAGEMDDLDKFINSPFGNGFSEELNNQLRDKQLQNIQNKMNRGEPLSEQDLKKLQEFNKTEALTTDKLAMADDMPSNDEIINAVQVLKKAGLNISTETPDTTTTKSETTAQTPAVQQANYYTPDPQIQQMSMMLNNGNTYNSDPMMNMLPYMMQNEGKNLNPQVIQAMMMNSMMNSLNGLNNTNNN